MPTTLFEHAFRRLRRHALHVVVALVATIALTPWPALAAPAKARTAAANQVLAECSWDRPGHNKFSGDVPTAIDRYTDIPADVRSRLKQRMVARDYDDMVSIKRDSIAGKRNYDGEIRDMYFGAGNICRTVTRSGWNAQMHERGMVYCDSGHCILVPTVCRNVSRIVRRETAAPVATASQGSGGDEGELPFDPPGAGVAALPDGAGGAPGNVGNETFASRSGTAGAAPDSWWPGSAPGARAAHGGPHFESAAASPERGPLPGIAWPTASRPQPEQGPGDFPGPLAAVPEPQAWCMLIAGLVLVVTFTRRHRHGGRSPTAP